MDVDPTIVFCPMNEYPTNVCNVFDDAYVCVSLTTLRSILHDDVCLIDVAKSDKEDYQNDLNSWLRFGCVSVSIP